MKKLVALILFLAIVVAGCNFPGQETKPKPVKPKPDAVKPGYFIGDKTPVKGTKEWVERYQDNEGVFEQQMEGYRVFLFTMGEKFTGGYQVNIKKVTSFKDKWVVLVEFKEPGPNDITTQVVNSPHEVINIVNDGKPVEVLQYKEPANQPVPLKIIKIP